MVVNKKTQDVQAAAGSETAARWLLLACIAISIIDPIAWTMFGFLRPGYSPIHQAISDLGVGPNGQIADALGFLKVS